MTTSGNTPAPSRPARPRSTWPNWINIGLGIYLALSPLWVVMGGREGWFIVLGVLIVIIGLWGVKAGSSALSQWAQIVMGILTFFSPWMVFLPGWATDVASTAVADWTAWIIGVLVIVFAVIGMAQGRASARV